MAKDATPIAPVTAHERQVADALTMLDFAIGSGVKAADGSVILQSIVSGIESTAAKLGMIVGKSADAGSISAGDWANFDQAYYQLATALVPVTAETLRNTAGAPAGSRTLWEKLRGDSPAIRFTRGLWLITIFFAGYVIGSNWYLSIIAMDPNTNAHLWWRTILELLTPWSYGGLGACVYLLRSAHTYIYLRTFDVRRKPEYYNRIMLGTIAGGAIIMFTNNIAGDDGTVIQMSSAALGFLAGYNTDLLFTAMERITNAILPKIGLSTVAPGGPGGPAGAKAADVNQLMEIHAKAKGPHKKFVEDVIKHVTGMRKG